MEAGRGASLRGVTYFLRQVPEVWFAARSLFTVLSSAYAMWAQPRPITRIYVVADPRKLEHVKKALAS